MIKDIQRVIDELAVSLWEFTDIAIVGMSGGADSTLVSTLCALALGNKNVFGCGMPYNYKDSETFNLNSKRVAEKLEINYRELHIGNAVAEVASQTESGMELSNLNYGNIKSRIRMVYLYTVCTDCAEVSEKRVRVIGTGNLSEDYIGYDTKGGDALADIFPIGKLYKSEVYQLLDFLVEKGYLEEDMIDRVPSAGLEDGQTDEGDLGYTYDEMEPAIKYLTGETYDPHLPESLIKFVLDRHNANKHKHEAPQVIDLKDFR